MDRNYRPDRGRGPILFVPRHGRNYRVSRGLFVLFYSAATKTDRSSGRDSTAHNFPVFYFLCLAIELCHSRRMKSNTNSYRWRLNFYLPLIPTQTN